MDNIPTALKSNAFDWDLTQSQEALKRKEELKALMQEELNMCKMMDRLFSTDEGKRVMEYLVSKTLDLPVAVPNAGEAMAYHREGQNSIIRFIQQQIKKGQTNG